MQSPRSLTPFCAEARARGVIAPVLLGGHGLASIDMTTFHVTHIPLQLQPFD